MEAVFEILVEPNRRRILDVLRDGEQSVSTIVSSLEISQSGVSRHLRVLREAGLVDVRIDAQKRMYRLTPQPLQELDSWIEPYRHYWNRHLDALALHLDTISEKRE